jgi:pimeloyl-ACP methyl ester carboxylesterase
MSGHERKIEIAVDSRRIDGTLVTPGFLVPGVLFVHGWGGSQQQYLARAHAVAALGSVCLTFDLGGHAGTQPLRETVSRESNLRDVIAAYDALAAHPLVDRSVIAVAGSSYGGYLATILTTLRPVAWLALRVPALYVDSGWELPKLQLHKEQDLRAYRRSFVAAQTNRALRACADFKGDVLIVESGHDDIVPPAVIKSYREACVQTRSLTYRCMAEADHGLCDEASQQAYTALLVQWFGEMFASARRDLGDVSAAAASAREAATHQALAAEPEAPPKASS